MESSCEETESVPWPPSRIKNVALEEQIHLQLDEALCTSRLNTRTAEPSLKV